MVTWVRISKQLFLWLTKSCFFWWLITAVSPTHARTPCISLWRVECRPNHIVSLNDKTAVSFCSRNRWFLFYQNNCCSRNRCFICITKQMFHFFTKQIFPFLPKQLVWLIQTVVSETIEIAGFENNRSSWFFCLIAKIAKTFCQLLILPQSYHYYYSCYHL